MALQFVLGNSGSGKTEMTYGNIVKAAGENPEKNYLILVPEQFTLETQQKLVELAPNHAIMNIDVLSFKRLAYRVFDDLGMNTTEILEETGKNLVLRKVAEDKREELRVLGSNMHKLGYINEVKSLISELLQYNVGPEQLEEYGCRTDVSKAFSDKLKDIAVMYRGFQTFMQDRYITAEEILHLLIAVVPQSDLLRNSTIVFDEFTGFTPIQNRLMRELFQAAEQIYVLLSFDACLDIHSPVKEHELFAMTRKTVRQLTEMAEELGIRVADPVICGDSGRKRFAGSPDLAHLEQQLFRPWIRKWQGTAEHLHLTSCQNPKEEMLITAREIARLVRDKGYRYRDIAVVTGAVDRYGCYAEDIFGRYHIPFFLDRTRDIVFHPFIETVRAIPDVVREDFSYSAMMRFLRSGYSGFEDGQIDRLDNYLTAIGGRGLHFWSRKWLRVPKQGRQYDLEELEEIRLRIMDIFAPFLTVLDRKTARNKDLVMALYDVIVKLQMNETLCSMEEKAEQAGEQIKAKEYSQLYRIVMQLLEKCYCLLGDERISVDEFSELLDAGLSAAQVAAIPPGFDSVTIGDIERTRLNHVKVLFFLGVNDGTIPKSTAEGGIISEFERDMLQATGIELAPGAREQTFIQRFYLYRNLTKPSDGLYLSWTRTDNQGKALRPSYLVDTLRQIFPDIPVEIVLEPDRILCTATPDAAMDYLVSGEENEEWYTLAASLLAGTDSGDKGRQELAARTMQLLRARFINGSVDPISRVIADALYGHNLDISVTRIERFAACAYSHFLKYGLRLQEREESGFENVDIGNLYHDALRNYGTLLTERKQEWVALSDEDRDRTAMEALQTAILEYPNLSVFGSASDQRQVERMSSIFKQTVWALTEQLKAGRFKPEAYELSFEEIKDSETLCMVLDREHIMNLYGRIDRVDLCRDGQKTLVKVIDYKSGNKSFDLIRVYEGRMLQLVVYADSALTYASQMKGAGEAKTGAVLYYKIDDPVIREDSGESITEEELRDKILESLRPDGLVSSEEGVADNLDRGLTGRSKVVPISLRKDGGFSMRESKIATEEDFAVMREYVRNFLADSGREIYKGNISINPYTGTGESSCSYCPYTGVCGINAKLGGTRERKPTRIEKKDVLETMRTLNAARQSMTMNNEEEV